MNLMARARRRVALVWNPPEPQVPDGEHLAALAELTVKLNDPWAAAAEMFGGRS